MSPLIVTCDEPPLPPLNGNNRKIHDILWALIGYYELHLVVYPRSRDEEARLKDYWNISGVELHFLKRRRLGRYFRAISSQLSLPTVTRDFAGELQIVRAQACRHVETKVLIDLISGSPLCQYLRDGVVISGHDCMSHFWREMGRWTPGPARRLQACIRRRFALHAERKFYHLAYCVHVVSRQDAQKLATINPAARYVVIPLGGQPAEHGKLLPSNARRGGLIWGNLDFPPIAAGFGRFLETATYAGLRLPGWRIIGGLPKAEALRRYPNLLRLGVEYFDRVPDVEAELGSVQYLMLPDIAGAGQKNRCLDGLRHGCCVVGLPEVFRDLPARPSEAYLMFESPEQMGRNWSEIAMHDPAVIGLTGQDLFQRHYTLDALGRRWRELIGAMPPVTCKAG